MKTYNSFINEVFNKKYEWKWINTAPNSKIVGAFADKNAPSFVAEFATNTIDGGVQEKIEVSLAYKFAKDGWYVDFESNLNTETSHFKLTNKGDALKKFGTIIDIITSAVKMGKIKRLISLSKEGNRTKLYKSMFKKVVPQWKLEQDREGSYDRLTVQK